MTNRRILVIGPSYQGALAETYAAAFERLGYEAFRCDPEGSFREDWYTRILRRLTRKARWWRMNRSALDVAKCVRPALILVVKCCWFDGDTIRQLRALGPPIVNYYPDHPYCGVYRSRDKGASTLRGDLIEVFREYTTVWTWEQGLVSRLRGDRIKAEFLPFAFDQILHDPKGGRSLCDECRNRHKVVFLGHCNAKRRQHIEAIHRHSVALWGNNWHVLSANAQRTHIVHNAGRYGADTAATHANADVALNILGELNMPGHNMRTFEITGAGGVMLAHFTAEQAEFFPENEAAIYYRAPAELDDKIAWLLAEPKTRERVRGNAQAIAQQHTYMHRAATLLSHYGLLCPHEAPARAVSQIAGK